MPMDPAMMGPPPGIPPQEGMIDPQLAEMLDQQAMLIAENQELLQEITGQLEQTQAENEQLMENQQMLAQKIMKVEAELEALRAGLQSAMTLPGVV